MAFTTARKLALSTALGAATLLGAHAIAQTQSQTQAPAQSQAQSSTPDATPTPPAQAAPDAQDAPRMSREGWRRGEGRFGYGDGYGRRGGGEGWGRGERRGRMSQLSDEDRAAMLSSRLAGAKAALLLTPEQEKLWGPIETAIREGVKARMDWRARLQKEGPAANPIQRMKRRGEIASARGAAMTKIADAILPLYESLSDDQKRRLRLVHRIASGGMGYGGGYGMGEGRVYGRGYGGGYGGGYGMGMGRGEGRGAGEGMRGGWRNDRQGYEGRGYEGRGYGRYGEERRFEGRRHEGRYEGRHERRYEGRRAYEGRGYGRDGYGRHGHYHYGWRDERGGRGDWRM